jgi:hypothetical protein
LDSVFRDSFRMVFSRILKTFLSVTCNASLMFLASSWLILLYPVTSLKKRIVGW